MLLTHFILLSNRYTYFIFCSNWFWIGGDWQYTYFDLSIQITYHLPQTTD